MTRLTDGKKTVEITMRNWDGNGWTPDWSRDFFATGSLHYDADSDAYTVQDVDYCVDQAMDWRNGVGDYYDDGGADVEDRRVDVDYI